MNSFNKKQRKTNKNREKQIYMTIRQFTIIQFKTQNPKKDNPCNPFIFDICES